MKRPLFAATFAALALFCSLHAEANQSLDGIVAVVGQGVVLESDLNTGVTRISQRMGDAVDRMPANVLRSRVLDHLILQKLQLQRAQRHGLQITDAEMQQAIDRLAAQNHMNSKEFLATLRAQGAPVNEMRGKLRDRLLMDKLRQKAVLGRVVVTDKDVDRYLESQSLRVQKDLEYHILHMLIAVDSGASAQAVANARERMQALRKKALGDASFRELAIAYSDGQNALQGGDLGWLRGGFLPTLFADVVPQLKKGEVSPIFRGRSGFHLIKLAGIRSISGDVAPDQAIVEEVKLRQILLKPNEIRDDKRAKKQLQDLRTRLQAGDDFAELARQHSDASSASKGGDMGWLQVKQLPPTLAKQIQQLKPNQTSEPFETPPGWQIIRLEGRRQRDLSEELRRQHARQAIGRRKMAQAGQRWLREMREDAYVDIRMKDYVNNEP